MAYQSINDVASIGVVSFIRSLSADVIHNLMLAFAGDAGVRNDNFELDTRKTFWRCIYEINDIPVSSPGHCSTFERPNNVGI